jgi:CRP-like cAMP-binding protein
VIPCFYFEYDGFICEFAQGHFYYKVAEFGAGTAFGDLALLEEKNNRRAASCIATERSELIYLGKEHFKETIQRLHLRALKKKAEFLKQVSCFQQ